MVSIAVSKKLEQVEKEITRDYPPAFRDLEANIPKERVDARGMVQVGGGSGTAVSDDGVILTNKHVVNEPFGEYTVITNDGVRFPATVLARDPMDDIAILQIQGDKKPPAARMARDSRLELGMTVLAFGNALGTFKNTVSKGIISGLSRSITAKVEESAAPFEMRGLIQTDAAINPGNSGGPITDIEGNVIGISTAVVSSAQNVGFAIPIAAARRDLDDLKKFGKIRRPLLGLRYITLTPDLASKLDLKSTYGALITKEHPLDVAVAPQGPAGRGGLKERDIILQWNGENITENKTIQDFLEKATVGETVAFKILRDRQIIQRKVTLSERR